MLVYLALLAVTLFPARVRAQGVAGEPGAGIAESGSLSLSNALAAVALDPSTGVLTSSLPIETPPARGGPQPGLALTYNSAAGIREAGVGWGFTVPSIERRNRDGAPRYRDPSPAGIGASSIEAMDRFVFDGKPLVPICFVQSLACITSTAAKVPQASPLPAWATDGWMYFRLETDDSRARFFWSPDRRTWRVQFAGGELLELGVPLARPRLFVGAADEGIDYDAVRTSSAPVVRHPFRWNAVRRFDLHERSGSPANLVAYRWMRMGRRERGYLTDVWDTPPAEAQEILSTADFAHHVRLTWEAPPFLRGLPMPGYRTTPDLRVVGIDVTSQPFSRSTRQLLRRYHVGYASEGNRYYLTSYEVEGRCASLDELGDGSLPATSCPRLPATRLRYSERAYATRAGGISLPSPPPHAPGKPIPVTVLDVDGDSLPDFLETKETSAPGSVQRLYRNGLSGGTYFASPVPITGPSRLFSRVGRTVTGSINLALNGPATVLWHATEAAQQGGFPTGSWGGGNIVRALRDPSGTWTWAGVAPVDLYAGAFNVPFDPVPPSVVGDVDGDGLADGVFFYDVPATKAGKTPKSAQVAQMRTHSLGAFAHSYTGVMASYVSSTLKLHSGYGPSPETVSSLDWANGERAASLVDMNGDGLGDLAFITLDPRASGEMMLGVRYWPGDGRGNFTACTSDACPYTANGTDAPSIAFKPFEIGVAGRQISPNEVALGDVNGDGFADLVMATPDAVKIYWNVDGRYWGGWDANLSIPASNVSAQWRANWPPRIEFADMNGNGLTDVVLIVGDEIAFIDVQNPSLLSGYGPTTPPAWAPRPGLLVGIDNGLGASTDVQYVSTTDLARQKSATGEAWTSPQPMQVVKAVRVTSGLPGDEPRTVTYDYDHPSFDGRERRFRGFRNVSATRALGSGTVRVDDTYFIGDPGSMWRTPLLVASELSNGKGIYHSTTVRSYRVQDVMPGAFGIGMSRAAYPERIDTLRYDTAAWSPSDATTPVTVAGEGSEAIWNGTVPVRSRTNVRIRTEQRLDDVGNVVWHVDRGRVKSDGGRYDEPIERTVIMNPPRSDWRFLPRSVTVAAFSGALDLPRQRRFEYDALGQLTKVFATLTGTLPLDRRHEDPLKAIAPPPSSASRDGEILVVRSEYDDFGNVTLVETPGDHCVATKFDRDYASLSRRNVQFSGGCGKGARATESEWDRGFVAETFTSRPDGSASRVALDDFGRVVALHAPDPATGAPSGAPSSRIEYQVTAGGPVQRVKVESVEGPGRTRTTWKYVDALGRGVLTLAEADPSAGDGGQWIVSGLSRRSGGVVKEVYEPWFYSGDPASHPLTPPTTSSTRYEHDVFGRVSAVHALDGSLTRQRVYRALGAEDIDAAGRVVVTTLNGHGRVVRSAVRAPGDERRTDYVYEVDGQLASIVQSHSADSTIVRRWFQHDSLGRVVMNVEPNSSTGFASAYSVPHAWRYAYDDAGQLVGTSDARGCGKNIAYDALGRAVAEDFSPCLGSQDNYSRMDASTGSGAEVLRTYDAPESGPSDDLGASATYLMGRLAETRARGAHDRFGYDARGRLVSVARQIARPGGGTAASQSGLAPLAGASKSARARDSLNGALFASLAVLLLLSLRRGMRTVQRRSRLTSALATLSCFTLFSMAYGCGSSESLGRTTGALGDGGYEAHWSRVSFAYDDADRVVLQTTGADVPELLGAGGESAVRTDYSRRGFVRAVGGSYGPLLADAVHAADGLTTSTRYADAAGTRASFSYDQRRRLAHYTLARTPGPWVAAPGYTPPPPGPSTLQGVLLDNTFGYDPVGNPTRIDDARDASEWPAGAAPVARAMQYDSFNRLARIDYSFAGGSDAQVDPYLFERASGRSPAPATVTAQRVGWQSFDYDWLGNLAATADDASVFYDRSLGTVAHGTYDAGPNQIRGAGPNLRATHDEAGNLVDVVVQRQGACTDQAGCVQRFVYEWDEVGQLARARRWDFASIDGVSAHPALPAGAAAVDLHYVYDESGSRVLKRSRSGGGETRHTAEIFPSLRLEHASWDEGSQRYARTADTEVVYLAGIGRVVHGASLPSRSGTPQHVLLMLGDHLGSTVAVIDRETSELVERTSQQAYGAPESDYRPARWSGFREPYQFTGKENDFEVGLTYFGARYYHAALGRFASADPLTIHAAGADANPYAYVSGSPLAMVDPYGLEGECLGVECNGHAPPGLDGGSSDGRGSVGPPATPSEEGAAPGRGGRGGATAPSASPKNPSTPAPSAVRVLTSGLTWAAKALLASNPAVSTTVSAVTDPRGAAEGWAKGLQAFALGPMGRLTNAVLAPAVMGAVTGEPIAIDTAEVKVIAVETALALVTMGKRSALLGAEVRAIEGKVVAAEASPAAGSIRGVNPTAAMENCVACSIATDAALGGSPASAIPGGPFSVVESITTYRPGAVGIPANGVGGIQTMMTNAGPGARGIVWGTRGTAPGHVFNVVNQGGTIRFLDGQIGGAAAAEGFETYYLFRTH